MMVYTHIGKGVSEGCPKRERRGISGLTGQHSRARITPKCPFVFIIEGDDRAYILQATVQTTSQTTC